MEDFGCDPDTSTATLANGVRVVALRLPYLNSASASVFVRTGSCHESRRLNGISHFVEHMAFKGTRGRDCQQISPQMLGEIVQECSFPEAELERERQVILHEYIEDEDDTLATAYKLSDKACFGTHP